MKPQVTKQVLEIFTVQFPHPKNPDVMQTFYFTNADRPVTYSGQQHIPLSGADAAKWLSDQVGV